MPLNIILFLKYFSFLSFQNFLMGEKLLSAPLSKHHCCHSFISMTKLHQHSFTHNCPCGRELFSFISPGNVSICTRESLKRASVIKLLPFDYLFIHLAIACVNRFWGKHLHVYMFIDEYVREKPKGYVQLSALMSFLSSISVHSSKFV